MKNFKYISYIGPNKYIFIRSHIKDYKEASEFASFLVEEKKIRVFFDSTKAKDEHYPDEIAGGILNSEVCVFIISKEAQDDLDFRNGINYALSVKKKVIVLKLGDFEFGYGLNIQLANVTKFTSYDELKSYILNNYYNEELIGEGQELINVDYKKRNLTILLLDVVLLIVIVTSIFAINRVKYYNSAEYVLTNLEDTDYFDYAASGFSQEDIKYLEGKSINKISFIDMGLTSVNEISNLNVKEIDISGNPNIPSLRKLLKNENIETVIVSQDMYKICKELSYQNIKLVISR